MQLRMLTQISGTIDGVDYPKAGQVGDFPDAVAADLISNGYATDDLGDVETATAPADDVETATAPKRAGLRKGDV